ncbi:MAG TPA: methyl-accepting chemotaxis protein [Treponemataceae bacterium]|nr:methyl-accepting chemotaxis protein [Treponemataceae bacterium]
MKLRKKLILMFTIVSVMPFVCGMLFILTRTGRAMRSDAANFMTEYTNEISGEIGAFFGDKIGYISALSHLPDITGFEWAKAGPALNRLAKEDGDIAAFMLVRADGSYYRSDNPGNPAWGGRVTPDNSDPDSSPTLLTERDYFKELVSGPTARNKQVWLSEPVFSKATQKKQIIIGTNLFTNQSTPVGLLAILQEAGPLSEHLTSQASRLGDYFGTESALFLVSDQGSVISMIAQTDAAAGYAEQVLTTNELWTLDDVPAEIAETVRSLKASNQETARFFWKEKRGFYHASIKRVPRTNYSVIFTVPDRTLYASVYSIYASMITISVLTFLVVLVISTLLGGRIAKPLAHTAKTLEDIAEGSGDLTYRIALSGKDETTDVGHFFNKFIETLHGMISQVKNQAQTMETISEELETSAEIIKSDIEGISGNVADLNFETEEQSASVTETSSTIHQIAKNIESLTRQIESQSSGVTESSAAIQQMVSNINSISGNLDRAGGSFEDLLAASGDGRDSMQNVIELVKDVSEQSQNLLETNEVINSIASQTNLLAMNAAIEAAHAGEAGKGFSVVSDEIRKLAESSSEQSKVIEGELKKVVSRIETIVEASAKADDAFGTVADSIREANGLVQEIRMSMKEQSEGSQQVLEALQEIQEITMQIRDGSLEMNQGATMILKEMSRLEDISHKVQKSTQAIARSSDTIGATIEEIMNVTGKNAAVVRTLNEITGRFKL